MAVRERVIFNGDAGTVWKNDTGKVRYQFTAALLNTCGACLQYHLAIGPWWPIPLHRNCRCRQYPIAPGADAPKPFVDFRELLDGMPHDQQVKAVGASNYKLISSGVVSWSEVVTKFRVRTLREVIALNKVSLETATKAGVKVKAPWVAQAFAHVHAPEAELIRQHRAELIDKLKTAGLSQDAVVHEISRGIVSQAGILGGGRAQSMASFVVKIPHAAELAAVLASFKPKKPKKPKPPEDGAAGSPAIPPKPPKPKPVPKPPEPKWTPGTPTNVDLPIDERIAKAKPAQQKLKRLLGRSLKIQTDMDAVLKEHAEVGNEMFNLVNRHGHQSIMPGGFNHDEVKRLENLQDELWARFKKLREGRTKYVHKSLNLPKSKRDAWFHIDNSGDWSKSSPSSVTRKTATDWLESKVARGEGKDTINVFWDSVPGVRAFAKSPPAGATKRNGGITISPTDDVGTHIHELGHQIEHNAPGALKASQEFLEHRVKGQTPRKLKDVFPSSNYRDDELGRDDEFGKAFGNAWYVGKDYGKRATEIISMGVEKLYDDPGGFAKNDPQFCTFIIGILDGSLRSP